MKKNKFLIWGTGLTSLSLLYSIDKIDYKKEVEIVGFIDNNYKKWGATFEGYPVYAPSYIHSLEFDYIDISSIYYNEIKHQLLVELQVPESVIKEVLCGFKEKLVKKYDKTDDEELLYTIEHIKNNHGLSIFNYDPIDNIQDIQEAHYDDKVSMYYVNWKNRKLYFERESNIIIKQGLKYLGSFWQEQDSASPHKYLEGDIKINKGDVVVEAGACEGTFSLEHIDDISKLYLVESSPRWMAALRKTFEKYKDKVVFCEKFLGKDNDEFHITLDSLLRDEKEINFIKMDIEGAEVEALCNGQKIIKRSKDFRCSICSYHKHGDEEKIKNILMECGCEVSASKGYMLFFLDKSMAENPELRKGIVRGFKH